MLCSTRIDQLEEYLLTQPYEMRDVHSASVELAELIIQCDGLIAYYYPEDRPKNGEKPSTDDINWMHQPLATLGEMHQRASELEQSATASWTGLRSFFVKLLLCVLMLCWVWNSQLVWTFLRNMDNYKVASLVMVIAALIMGFVIPEEKSSGFTFAFCFLGLYGPPWVFFWFVSSVDANVQLFLTVFSILLCLLFLTKFRLFQSLTHNLPVLNTTKHQRDKEEYTQLREQIQKRAKILHHSADLAHSYELISGHSDPEHKVLVKLHFMAKYYEKFYSPKKKR